MEVILIFILFIISFKYSLEIIPNWNLNSSGINLLSSSETIKYTVVDREMYSFKLKLSKTIIKSGNIITQNNTLSINGGYEFNVEFENIESFYHLNGIDIICPKGKYHPYDATNKKYLIPANFEEKGDWNLKCYNHKTNYFLVFYLMKGEKNFFYSPSQYDYKEFSWMNKAFAEQIFDFKLENGDEYIDGNGWKNYQMGALILENNYLKLKSLMAQFHYHYSNYELIYIYNSIDVNPLSINLTEAKKYTQAYFNNYSDEFYFYTYNSISDFISGYSNVTTSDYTNLDNVQFHINSKSPFEFLDEAEIIDMNFLLYSEYIYYTINNTKTGEIYHGLYDIKLDKIVFNTNENITTFIPYTSNSMLVITEENAYKICVIKNGNNCIDNCENSQVMLDIEGNKCGTDCDNDKYLLIPYNICITECDSRIYISDEKNCGLCKDMNSLKPYKIIGSTECLSFIPDNTEIYNINLKLLICKNGYKLEEYNCIPDCYSTCKECSELGNETNNKCNECIDNYIFINDSLSIENNCYEICEYYYYFNELKQYKCTLSNECPSEYNKLISDKKKCIDDCKNDNDNIYMNIIIIVL